MGSPAPSSGRGRRRGEKPNLRRILQELYARGLYNPLWLEEKRNQSRTGRAAPALGYWKPYEVATVEETLRRSRLVGLTRDDVLGSEILLEERGDEAKELLRAFEKEHESVGGWSARTWHDFVHVLWDGRLIDKGELQARVERRLAKQGTEDRLKLQMEEELDAVELAVRESTVWWPSSRRPGRKLGLGNLYATLKQVGALEASATPERVLQALEAASRSEILIETKGTPEDPPQDQISVWDPDRILAVWYAAGKKPNLRRILQELYERGLYDPFWLGERAGEPLGYRESYELAAIEEALRGSPPVEASRAELLASEMLSQEDRDRVGQWLDYLEKDPDRPWADATWRELVRALRDEGLIDEDELQERVRRRLAELSPGAAGPGELEQRADPQLTEAVGLVARLRAWIYRTAVENATHVLAYGARREVALDAAADPRTGEADRPWNPYERPFQGTLVLFLVGLAWVLLYPLMLMLVRWKAVRQIADRRGVPWWRDAYEKSFSLLLILVAAVAFIEVQPYLIYHYGHLLGKGIWWPLAIGAASLLVSMIAGPAIAFFRGFGKKAMLVLVALLGPVLPLLVYIHLVLWVIYRQDLWSGYYVLDRPLLAVCFIGAAVIVHFFNLPIDVNSTSLHGFYRDRLSTAYLMRAREDSVIVPGDDVPLNQICESSSGAPYHLVNATLNLQGTKDATLRRRRGDFFQFSKYFVGSKQTGYCSTDALQAVFPHLYVSSAMAVSAAAAAPNMGTFTSGPLVVLMALLNVRLGYWLPNPNRVKRWREVAGSAGWFGVLASSLVGSFRVRPGAYQLLKEMLSVMRADLPLVNLTDGGHMENTGVFLLLRRRCQFIIVGDAEADPEMRFGGLAALIRYARIDLGIEIEIHVDDLRLDDEGESRQHCALGVIRYPKTESAPAAVGYLLYIKSSITGDEDEIVSEHHRKSPLFPHESTADQFFDEGQFEAYRDLGYHICSSLFDEFHKDRVETFEECSEWFEMLSISLSPGLSGQVAFTDVQSALSGIERTLREPGYSRYFYEIYPELESAGHSRESRSPEEAAEEFRNIFHLVKTQLQLMESLFISLELAQRANRLHPANRGWMNLFRRWVKAPSFKRAYLASVTTYSAPFQQFCQAALGLELQLQWETLTAVRHAELAGRADEIGLESLRAPMPDEGEALILTARLEGTEAILIAESVVKIEEGKARVLDLDLRAGYQGAGMRARSMLALKGWARERDLVLGFSEAASVAADSEDHAPSDAPAG